MKKTIKRRRYVARLIKRFVPVVMLAMVITLFAITTVGAAESKNEQTYKFYTSVQIESGDSLWSIANEYCYDCDMDVNSYIEEIRTINNLTDNTINSGEYLIVFYYAESPIQ